MDDILNKIPSAMPSMIKLGWKVTNLNIGDNDSSLMRRGREQGPFMKLETAEGDSIVIRPPPVDGDSKGSSTKGSYDHRQVCEYTSPGVVRSEIENLIALFCVSPVDFGFKRWGFKRWGKLDEIQSGVPLLSKAGWKVFSMSREYILLTRGPRRIKIYCADYEERNVCPRDLCALLRESPGLDSSPRAVNEVIWLFELASLQRV